MRKEIEKIYHWLQGDALFDKDTGFSGGGK